MSTLSPAAELRFARLRVGLGIFGVIALSTGCRMTVATVTTPEGERPIEVETFDEDGDGVSVALGDCNDADAEIFPGATETCDGIDNDCGGGIDDAGACSAERSITQTLAADVLLVVDTHDSMDPLLDDVADYAWEFGQQIGGPAADVNVGVVSMSATGDLFHYANRSFVAAGAEDGAERVTEWVRAAIGGLEVAEDRGRGRDSVLSLLVDSADIDIKPPDPGDPDDADAAGAESTSVQDSVAGGEGNDSPWLQGAFRRDDVPLAVVFVSRSDDHSHASVDTFFRAMDAVVSESKATVHAVVSRGGPCGDLGSFVAPADSYLRMVDQTGGLALDVCDLGAVDMTALGEAIATSGLINVHRLPADLDPARPMRLSALSPTGQHLDFAPEEYEVDLEAWRLIVHAPPVAGSELVLAYERLP